MKIVKILSFLLFILLSIPGLVIYAAQANESVSRKIIVFKVGLNETAKDELVGRVGGIKLKNLGLISGRAAWLSSRAAEKLAKLPGVARIDDDVVVEALENSWTERISERLGASRQAQVLPWGIDRVDAELVWPTGNTGDPVKVGIIDTGISNIHPDLLGNIKGGVNTIQSRRGWNDDNGHGSHVAGIVAALNNSIGVVGVGPAIDLYAIKVLGASGSGYLSDVIEGLDWAITNHMQVVNLSLGTGSNIQSFHDAIMAVKTAGIVIVAAAGNSGGAVSYPAAYPEAIAVSATDQNNTIASWSSRGPEVDLGAPGVAIYSTYKGTGYATLSGTSMASPHVAGVAALVLNTPVGNSDTNNNGKWDPDEVQSKLQISATDLGTTGFDNLYGWGLVNAWAAVQ